MIAIETRGASQDDGQDRRLDHLIGGLAAVAVEEEEAQPQMLLSGAGIDDLLEEPLHSLGRFLLVLVDLVDDTVHIEVEQGADVDRVLRC